MDTSTILISLCSIADGLLNMEEGTLSKSKLETYKCYLLDCGAEVFVWFGRATQMEVRKSASKAVQVMTMTLAIWLSLIIKAIFILWLLIFQDFIHSQSRPMSMRMTRVIQGYETQSFKSNFESWPLHTETSTEEGRGKVSGKKDDCKSISQLTSFNVLFNSYHDPFFFGSLSFYI